MKHPIGTTVIDDAGTKLLILEHINSVSPKYLVKVIYSKYSHNVNLKEHWHAAVVDNLFKPYIDFEEELVNL